MRRLNRALHKRQNAEIDIWKQLKALEKSRRALANLLVEVCHVRLETTAEISTTGRVPEKAPKLVCNGVILYECDDADHQSSDHRPPEEKLPMDIPHSILLYKLTLLYLLTYVFCWMQGRYAYRRGPFRKAITIMNTRAGHQVVGLFCITTCDYRAADNYTI